MSLRKVLFFALLGHIAVVNGQAAFNLGPVIQLKEVKTACGYLEYLSQNYTNSLSKRAQKSQGGGNRNFRKNQNGKPPVKVGKPKSTSTKPKGKKRRSLNRRQVSGVWTVMGSCFRSDILAEQEACLYSGTADANNSAAYAPFDPVIPNTYNPGYLNAQNCGITLTAFFTSYGVEITRNMYVNKFCFVPDAPASTYRALCSTLGLNFDSTQSIMKGVKWYSNTLR